VYVQNEWSTVAYTDEKGNVKFMKYWDEQAYVSIYPPPEHVPLPNTAESYANRLAVTTEETKPTTDKLDENDKPDNSVTILHKPSSKPETKLLTKSNNKFEIKIDLKKSATSAKRKIYIKKKKIFFPIFINIKINKFNDINLILILIMLIIINYYYYYLLLLNFIIYCYFY